MNGDPLREALVLASRKVCSSALWRSRGAVISALGPLVEAHLPDAQVGSRCRLSGGLEGEVVGFSRGLARVVVMENTSGLRAGAPVWSCGSPTIEVGEALLGRILNAYGKPIDGGPALDRSRLEQVYLDASAPDPMKRRRIEKRLDTGIRAVDGLCPLGRGQRVALLAGPGVGKSTLLGDFAAGSSVDVVVTALVGERGREVREMLEGSLAHARDRSVVVAAPGDAPPLVRARATMAATAIAEYFRDKGASVLLLVDSLTRYARALREIGLAAGETPVRGGFPPSVFAAMPRLIERAGVGEHGEITAIYTVLCEEEGGTDALADEVKGLVDGHLLLSKQLAERSHWPALNIPGSLSRVANTVAGRRHMLAAAILRKRIAAYEERRELIVLGAYQGGDTDADAAIADWDRIEKFLCQPSASPVEHAETLNSLLDLTGMVS